MDPSVLTAKEWEGEWELYTDYKCFTIVERFGYEHIVHGYYSTRKGGGEIVIEKIEPLWIH